MRLLRPLACLVLVLAAPLARGDERTKRIDAAELKVRAHLAKCSWADAGKACGRLARAVIVRTWAEDPELEPLIAPQRMDTLFRVPAPQGARAGEARAPRGAPRPQVGAASLPDTARERG